MRIMDQGAGRRNGEEKVERRKREQGNEDGRWRDLRKKVLLLKGTLLLNQSA